MSATLQDTDELFQRDIAYKVSSVGRFRIAYRFWTETPEANLPGFDFSQFPKEKLMSIKEKKSQLNKWHKLVQEDFTHTYVSDRLAPESFGYPYSGNYAYTYDDRGNLTSIRGKYSVYSNKNSFYLEPDFNARYKTF